MKLTIVGSGAIGAYMGARLARAGFEVTLFARGAQLRALAERGVRVEGPEDGFGVRTRVVADLKEAGRADVVVLGVKAHSLPELAPRLRPLIGPDTIFVSTQNGLPWWYFQKHGGEFEGLRLETVDPGGAISSVIEADRIVGSIAYFATEIVEPGVVRHIEGSRISLGELDGSRSERIRNLAAALVQSGFRAPITTKIRSEIWVKLIGNLSFNPISALTRATLVEIARDPEARMLVRSMMAEAETVARRIGIELPISLDQRIAGAEKVGEHKTSMLQDIEAGRPIEVEAIVGAVLELGKKLDIDMPYTRAVYACTKLMAKRRGT